IRNNKLIYQDKPRLKTALEMLRASMTLEDSLGEVTLPFFVLHGEADTVTDPEVSKALYERAGSKDKTIKLYPGMWHGLTSGEPDNNVEIVFSDIIAWLDNRCGVLDGRPISAQPINQQGPSIETLSSVLSPTKEVGKKPRRTGSYRSYL
ncbi:acylglycerol lipase, partial [Sarracenia purpurea var. burkii]